MAYKHVHFAPLPTPPPETGPELAIDPEQKREVQQHVAIKMYVLETRRHNLTC